MSIKIKISIIAICFALVAAVCIGFVFAAPNETITMNGNVSYEVAKATISVSPNLPDLGSTTGSGSSTGLGPETGSGEYVIGETVTLTAETKSGSTFRAWATSTDPNTMEILSTLRTYSFELTEDSPTTYYALFYSTTTTEQTVGDLTYTFYNEAKLAMITDATSTSLSGAFEIPSVVESEGNSYKVYSIGANAFRDCSSLTTISIPEGVTSIGTWAFQDCSSLTTISIPEGVTSIGERAFYGCSSLTSIIIPEGVTEIDLETFRNCRSLTTISIPEGVTEISYYAFSGCSSLEAFYGEGNEYYTIDDNRALLVDGGKTLLAYARANTATSYTIPVGVTKIVQDSFRGCYSLTSVSLPSTLTSIGGYAFSSCYALAIVYNNSRLNIRAGSSDNGYVGYYAKEIVKKGGSPQGKIEIDGDVQYYVNGATNIALAPSVPRDSLTSITIREGTTEINQQAFQGCSNLTSISIPEGETSIGSSAFTNCSSLTTISIPEGVTSIGSQAFQGCSNLTSVSLPSTLTSIGNYAFSSCYALAIVYNNSRLNITAGSSDNGYVGYYAEEIVSSGEEAVGKIEIADDVQYYVNEQTRENIALAPSVPRGSLTSVTIREGTTEINQHAFRECSSLTSVSLPSTLTSIGYYAFNNCSGLTEITIPEGVTSIGNVAFSSCSGLSEITINGNISTLGPRAFQYCTNLTKLTLGANVTSIPSSLFSTDMLTNLTEIVVLGDLNSTTFPSGTWYKDNDPNPVTSFDGAGTYSTTKPA